MRRTRKATVKRTDVIKSQRRKEEEGDNTESGCKVYTDQGPEYG